jgi:Ca2+-binding RTX toxin-like protein
LDNDANTHGTVNASAMTGNLSATVTTDFLTLTGGAGADDITIGTTALAYVLDGGAGVDTITVGGAIDLSNATLSNFEVFSGNQEITVAASQIAGSTYSTADSDFIVDVIDVAVMDFSGMSIGQAADGVLTTAVFGGSVSSSTNLTITGTAGTDSFTVGAGADTIDAGGGDDTIVGGDGLNVLNGGAGADSITGGADADIINGGAGDDVTLAGGGGADTIDGGAGADTITGGAGVDTITGGAGIDTITGGAGADIIDLTETTAVTDDVNIAVHSTDGIDVITGFTAGLLANGGDTIGTTAGIAVAYNDLTGEDFSAAASVTAAATLAIVEDNTTNATDAQNDAIAFMYDSNMYVVVQTDGDAAAFATTTDALVQLVGVDGSDLIAANFIA